MNKTKEILMKMRNAVSEGGLSAENIPIEDIKTCVYSEIGVYQATITEEQYESIWDSCERVNAHIAENEDNISKILLWLDALILCVDMLSDMILSLANRDYWEYKHRHHLQDAQVQEIIDFIDRHHAIRTFSYDFVDEYDDFPVEVYMDEACGMLYIPYKNRKMYFPKSYDVERVARYFRGIMAEQDERSPHCYRHEMYGVKEGDVVVDVGAAEGVFALDVIDIASKIFMIEADEEWVEALQQTFKNDSDKVQIIYGFADCVVEGDRVKLDGLFNEEINYIKMDIEGYEKPALQGAIRLLDKARNMRCAICAYHCRGDEEWIRKFLQQYGFETEVSRGYMCPEWTVEAYTEAELRRGLVFGRKEITAE